MKRTTTQITNNCTPGTYLQTQTFSLRPKHSTRNFSASSSLQATLLRRPKRPYQFTQLVSLSDGSTYTHRTTSPIAVYKSIKDVRNTPLWNPTNVKLAAVEEDEAGRLRAFRKRFGRGFDAQESIADDETLEEQSESVQVVDGVGARVETNGSAEAKKKENVANAAADPEEATHAADNLMDLIGSFSTEEEKAGYVGAAGVYKSGSANRKKKK